MKYLSTLTLQKSTRGTHVYANDDFNGIYIPKRLFPTAAVPMQLTIVLTDEHKKEEKPNVDTPKE